MDEYLTTFEISSILKVHVLTVRRWIEKGILPAYKFNKEYRISKSDFENFVNERKVNK